ncbi:MAG TPA: hypothetical protein PK992_13830 [Planctomycetaceae bacterium]|nr:hypothetical protein [Planctomycetaceae bacterium]
MIWTLRIKLMRHEDPWSADIEIESSTTLDELHLVIQSAVGFDNDHMYEFSIARNERARTRDVFDDENGELYSTAIESIFPLEPKKSLYYLFDYGDSWYFKITKTQKRIHEPKEKVKYPRIVSETGTKPIQYPNF